MHPADPHSISPPDLGWQDRLRIIVETMREMSRQTDPQRMTRDYGARMRQLFPTDRFVSLSRRDLSPPEYRITRSSLWDEEINPWTERDRLPLLAGGLLGELLYGEEPRLIDQLAVSPADPAAAYFEGMQSLVAVPHFDGGKALNMVVLMRCEPAAFAPDDLPEIVWMSNLFGRATQNLVMAAQVQKAFDAVDQEMRIVAEIQHALLPAKLPAVPTLALAASYETSARAGGDYYDLFRLPDGKWGIIIADVSGHGIPAAVLMAVTHAIAHSFEGPTDPPGLLLAHLNRQLTKRYTAEVGAFVTAFYGIYDPATRTIRYASAGHPPPRVKRCADGSTLSLDGVQRLPLGILAEEAYPDAVRQLEPGDQLVFFTDGVTEAEGTSGDLFGLARLDRVLADCSVTAKDLLAAVIEALHAFTGGRPATDDRTILVGKVS